MPECPHPKWLISAPVTRYSRKDQYGVRMKGDMVETTTWTCAECGKTKRNEVVLPPEWDY
jgi:hypothetical protein